MRSFFSELKRRNVIRVAIAYGAMSWLLLQVFGLVMPAFDIPVSALRALILAVALGFPIALLFAWVYELTPEGFRREVDVDPANSIARQTGRRLDFFIIGLLAALLMVLLLDRFVLPPRGHAVHANVGTSAPATAAPVAGIPASTPSIAVLPFTDMSQAGDQAYFSDGLSEELLDLLAQVPGLNVAGRTSSFSFKNKDATITQIGKALNVSAVLEGSVRKSGDRLRVTTQLISVDSGYHLWSKTYDRKLTDVFAVQDEIAGAVVDALKLELLPTQRPSTGKHHVPGYEAYDQYLTGRQLMKRGEEADFIQAANAFRRAVALDPDYAAAYAGLAMAESFIVENDVATPAREQGRQRAMAAAERAVALDPELGDAHATRGYLRQADEWDWDGAFADLTKAVALAPNEAPNQLRYGHLLATLGRLPEAEAALEKGTALDPLFTPAWVALGRVRLARANYSGARVALKRALTIDPDMVMAAYCLGVLALLQGDDAAAHTAFAKAESLPGLALAEYLGNPVESERILDRLVAQHAGDDSYSIATVFAWRGNRDQAFAWLERAIAQKDAGMIYLKYDPLLQSLRNDPRYAALLGKLRLPS